MIRKVIFSCPEPVQRNKLVKLISTTHLVVCRLSQVCDHEFLWNSGKLKGANTNPRKNSCETSRLSVALILLFQNMVPYFTCVDLQCLNNSDPSELHLGRGEYRVCHRNLAKWCSATTVDHGQSPRFVCSIMGDVGVSVCFCKTQHFSSKSTSEHGGSAYSSNMICKHPTRVFLTNLTLLFFYLKKFYYSKMHIL